MKKGERTRRSPIVVLCLDGVSWEYIEEAKALFLNRLKNIGTAKTCSSMVPTVTNVNNASILTGTFPDEHGISSNWYYDPVSGTEVYMDSHEFLTCQTFLEKEAVRGGRTLLLTVKDKLRRLLADNSTKSYSVEKPSAEIIEEISKPPDIYSIYSSPWLIKAAVNELMRFNWDLVYVSTTDYVPHKYAPDTPEAKEYMRRLDEEIERLNELDIILGIVSDHGMNSKGINLDLERLLRTRGIEAKSVASIKDEHFVHHQNLGGSAYLYVEGDAEKALGIVSSTEGVELALTRMEATSRFRLPSNRIGDLLVLAEKDYTFGSNEDAVRRDVNIRSHGSLHEREAPFMLNRKIAIKKDLYNKDIIPILMDQSESDV